jgi:hypothetical protein
MKAYWGSGGIVPFLTSGLDGGDWYPQWIPSPLVSIRYDTGWVPEPVWTRW